MLLLCIKNACDARSCLLGSLKKNVSEVSLQVGCKSVSVFAMFDQVKHQHAFISPLLSKGCSIVHFMDVLTFMVYFTLCRSIWVNSMSTAVNSLMLHFL